MGAIPMGRTYLFEISMNDINILFFELIHVALGVRVCLSHSPSANEWGALYSMAKKQSLVGVCFAGVQRLQQQKQVPPEMLYLTWMGMAAKIQQRNEVLNKQCVELQARLSVDGIKSCVLKGQGVALLYVDKLRWLRQSGDIDIWVDLDYDKIIEWAKCNANVYHINDHHINMRYFKDTDVEMHYQPATLLNRFKNREFRKWVSLCRFSQFSNRVSIIGCGVITTPTLMFNSIFLLVHMHNHFFHEGLGLRQVMDYYFLLQEIKGNLQITTEFNKRIKELRIKKFAQGIMWVLHMKFNLDKEYLLCTPNEKIGLFVLSDIMRGGNFGHYDDSLRINIGDSHFSHFVQRLYISWRYIKIFPHEFIWSPIYYIHDFINNRLTRKDKS